MYCFRLIYLKELQRERKGEKGLWCFTLQVAAVGRSARRSWELPPGPMWVQGLWPQGHLRCFLRALAGS